MSKHFPGVEDRTREFAQRLFDYRTADQSTQEDLAASLGISRKTYILMEQDHWWPHERERHFMVHTLYKLDPSLAGWFAMIYETELEDWGIHRRSSRPPSSRLSLPSAPSRPGLPTTPRCMPPPRRRTCRPRCCGPSSRRSSPSFGTAE